MKIDVLVAEIGSTTTVVNAFDDLSSESPRFLGQGIYRTTVPEGDVRIGLEGAIGNLKQNLSVETISWNSFYAASSAAGGLRMSVHGLVHDMTVRAAKEAALGAGANIVQITSGRLSKREIEKLTLLDPNIIMIAGGVDYGERETALCNAELIAEILKRKNLYTPVIYAGNIVNKEDIEDIFSSCPGPLEITENVYPKIDTLVVQPVREIIQRLFEENITNAPGMEHIREMVNGPILPTPGGVMLGALLFKENFGDVVVFDVGGATTDIHSVTEGSANINRIQISPQPEAKRTVEGDLGVFVNRRNILKDKTFKQGMEILGTDEKTLALSIEKLGEIPKTEEEFELVRLLTSFALKTALKRHSGIYRSMYSDSGRTLAAEGRDLTAVKYCVGTGGALTRLGRGKEIMKEVISQKVSMPGGKKSLYPPEDTTCLLDNHYIMASLGVLSKKYPKAAVILLKRSLRIGDEP